MSRWRQLSAGPNIIGPVPGGPADEAGIVSELCFDEGRFHRQARRYLRQPFSYRVKQRSFSTNPATDDDEFGSEAPCEVDDANRDIFDHLHPECGGALIPTSFQCLELLTGVDRDRGNVGEARDAAPGGQFFQSGRLTLGKGMTIDDRMADLGNGSPPPDEAPVQEDTGSDPRRDREEDNVGGIRSRAKIRLANRSEVGVISDGHRTAEPSGQSVLGELVDPARG
jgi:hypothetical protein